MPRRMLALIAMFVVVASMVTVAIVQASSSAAAGDGSRFFEHLAHYGAGWSSSGQPGRPQRDMAWVRAHHPAVLAEGRLACDWLAARPDAPKPDPSGRSDFSALVNPYAASHRIGPLAWPTRATVVGAAWNYLCDDVRRAKTAPSSYQDD